MTSPTKVAFIVTIPAFNSKNLTVPETVVRLALRSLPYRYMQGDSPRAAFEGGFSLPAFTALGREYTEVRVAIDVAYHVVERRLHTVHVGLPPHLKQSAQTVAEPYVTHVTTALREQCTAPPFEAALTMRFQELFTYVLRYFADIRTAEDLLVQTGVIEVPTEALAQLGETLRTMQFIRSNIAKAAQVALQTDRHPTQHF